jgi:hypothetical protein
MNNAKQLLYIITVALIFSCNANAINQKRVVQIGHELMKADYSQGNPVIKDIVLIGEGLAEKMKEVKFIAKQYKVDVQKGDFKAPHGDGKADCVLIIDTDYQDIGVRLQFNRQKDQYNILGWMQVSSGPDSLPKLHHEL